MSERIQSLSEFWHYYLGEHRDPRSRRLHFVGTLGAFVAAAMSISVNPIWFSLSLVGMVIVGAHAVRVERTRKSIPHVLLMLALPIAASPIIFPLGIVFAYGCAWIGHFGFEKNRPATFSYPVMSLASDFRLLSCMARGQYWSGDILDLPSHDSVGVEA